MKNNFIIKPIYIIFYIYEVMEDYIKSVVYSMYDFIDEVNTPYLTKNETKNKNFIKTNCGVNSEIIFSLLIDHRSSEKNKYFKKIDEINFEQEKVYKIFNIWGHPHSAIFYYYENKWIFVESSEQKYELLFKHMTKQEIINFLMNRQNISDWQEICVSDSNISRVNIAINRLKWIKNIVKNY